MATFFLFAENIVLLFDQVSYTKPPGTPTGIGFDLFFVADSASGVVFNTVHNVEASNTLALQDNATPATILNIKTSNYLEIHSTFQKSEYGNCLSILHFTHEARSVKTGEAFSFIIFSDQLKYTRAFSQVLTFSQNVSYHIVKAPNIVHTLNFKSHVTGHIYNNYRPILIDAPVFVPTLVNFSYGTLSLSLVGPDLGNVDSLEQARINRTTRNGDLTIFRDPMWPQTEIITYKFIAQSQETVDRVLQFIDASLGQNIDMVDFEGQSWTAIILEPMIKVIQNERGKGFEFELKLQINA